MPAIMEITEAEAWGVDVAEGSIPRRPGDKTAASYLNFLIVNGGVICWMFDDPNDDVALEIIARVFPEREVVTVPGREIVLLVAATYTASRSSSRRADAADARGRRRRPAKGPAAAAVLVLLASRTGMPRTHHLVVGAPPVISSLPQGSQSVSSR